MDTGKEGKRRGRDKETGREARGKRGGEEGTGNRGNYGVINLYHRAGERDVPEAEYFGPVARKVKGPKSAVSGARTAKRT